MAVGQPQQRERASDPAPDTPERRLTWEFSAGFGFMSIVWHGEAGLRRASTADPDWHGASMNRDRIAVLVMTTTTLLAVTVLGPVATSGASLSSPTTQAAAENPQRTVTASQKRSAFAGHRPGRIYLGMSCGVECPKRESHLRANVGLKRWFKQWGNWNGVAEAIKEDRRKNRRTWISIEGPRGGAPSGWLAVAQGDFDRQIRDLARVLKRQDRQPIFLSFDHEMSNKASESQASWWARGFNRFHDVLKRAHALRRVALAPIHASWLFSKFNGGKSPAKWLPPGVLRRSSFVAVDVYQNWKGESFGNRISRVDRWLDRHGHPRHEDRSWRDRRHERARWRFRGFLVEPVASLGSQESAQDGRHLLLQLHGQLGLQRLLAARREQPEGGRLPHLAEEERLHQPSRLTIGHLGPTCR